MATKPIIANPRCEYDARSLVLADLATVVTWPDVSPFGTNDLSQGQGAAKYQQIASLGGAGTPWSLTLPAVRIEDDEPSLDNFSFPTPFGSVGTPITLFVVGEASRLDGTFGGMAFWGTSDGINPPVGVYLFISAAGEIWFIMGANGALSASRVVSAAGLIKPGDRFIITARREEFPSSFEVSAGPMIIRLNGEQVGFRGSSAWTDFWFSPRMHQCNLPSTGGFPGTVVGNDGLYAHLLGFQTDASDEEIIQMEAWLSEIWDFDFQSKWFPEGTQLPVATTWVAEGQEEALKPAIVGLEVEWDARNIVGLDNGDPINPWIDSSGQGNAAAGINLPIYETAGWPPTLGPAVHINQPGDEHFTFNGAAFVGTEFTMFFMVQPISLVGGNILMGGSSFSNLQIIEVTLRPDGSVLFGMFTSETGADVVISATGLVSDDDIVLITVRHSNTTGKILRLNGVQIASSSGGTNDLTSYPNPQFGSIAASFFSDDLRMAWISGYTSAASDAEIEQMEAFLSQQFIGSPPAPPTDWTPA
jgi:hypothetical protein